MALDADKAGGEGLGYEFLFEVFVGEVEYDVHVGAIVGSNDVFVEAFGVVDGAVEEVGFGGVFFLTWLLN